MDKSYIVNKVYILVVLRIKKELLISEYKDRSYIIICRRHIIVVSLISYPYSD